MGYSTIAVVLWLVVMVMVGSVAGQTTRPGDTETTALTIISNRDIYGGEHDPDFQEIPFAKLIVPPTLVEASLEALGHTGQRPALVYFVALLGPETPARVTSGTTELYRTGPDGRLIGGFRSEAGAEREAGKDGVERIVGKIELTTPQGSVVYWFALQYKYDPTQRGLARAREAVCNWVVLK